MVYSDEWKHWWNWSWPFCNRGHLTHVQCILLYPWQHAQKGTHLNPSTELCQWVGRNSHYDHLGWRTCIQHTHLLWEIIGWTDEGRWDWSSVYVGGLLWLFPAVVCGLLLFSLSDLHNWFKLYVILHNEAENDRFQLVSKRAITA